MADILAFALFCKEKAISDYDSLRIDEKHVDLLFDIWESMLQEKIHSGDCTDESYTCLRCYTDSFAIEAELILRRLLL